MLENIPVHDIEQQVEVIPVERGGRFNFNGTHRHNFYEVLYFTQADEGALHTIDFIEYPVSPDYIYVLRPGQVHRLELTTHKGYIIAIRPEFFDNLLLHFEKYIDHAFPSVVPLDTDRKVIVDILGYIFGEYHGRNRKELITAYLNTLLTHLVVLFRDDGMEKGVESRMRRLLALVEEHYITEREVDFYADKLALSKKRLDVISKETFGLTVKQMLQQRLLLEAKRSISCGNSTLKSIAYELGFRDASYFSRFFKQNAGVTPEEFGKTLHRLAEKPRQ